MNKSIWIELKVAQPFCILGAVILMILAGPLGRADAQMLTTLWSFTGGNDGANPQGGITLGRDGYFYGTTSKGGATNCGTVFRISPTGGLTNLWSFTGGADGGRPDTRLVQATDGHIYGTTTLGGISNCGTVFRISPDGSLTNLYSFKGRDGSPAAELVQGGDGNFYGTTPVGGAVGQGTVFRISASGSLTTLHSFSDRDGTHPWAGLVQGDHGYFYGTTTIGGEMGQGTVFRISPSGSLTSVWSFTVIDGETPHATLALGRDGYLYGTTESGGTNGGVGTVFRISPGGKLTNLWMFNPRSDGANPSGLIQGGDGDFYGTTRSGGVDQSACGTVFKISSNGKLTILHSFNCGDGGMPCGGLVQDRDGDLYGTTILGGAHDLGTVFRINPMAGH